MIPVELRLKNFMSYGTDTPVLDFEQFHVACLSGNNGQGKSALLDAITWAVWGEARKGSGSQKPDAELLRIGALEMRVEFCFDVEGDRYKVVRWYQRSASGKSNKSGLELALQEPGTDSYRPLTGANQRETQQHVENVVGLDYDTFINSAFLLQGRSDEFTKKRPSERKEILARILNLSRYERLFDMAGEREREARRKSEEATLHIERLKDAVAPEPEWKEQRAQLDARIEEEQEKLESVRAAERCLAEKLAGLEARAREAASRQEQIGRLVDQIKQANVDEQDFQQKIEQAQVLIGQAEQIQKDFERHQALQKERDVLDTKSELFRGIEKQIARKEGELKDQKNTLERQLDKVSLEIKSKRSARDQCRNQLAEQPSVKRRLDLAKVAKTRLAELSGIRAQREQWREEMAKLERELHGQREALLAQQAALEKEIVQKKTVLPSLALLEEKKFLLEQRKENQNEAAAALEATKVRGQEIAEAMRERAGKLEARSEALTRHQESLTHLLSGAEDKCPTCGTALTPQHREEVASHYRENIAALEREILQINNWLERKKVERDELRHTYKEQDERLKSYAGIDEEKAHLQAQIQQRHEADAALADLRERAAALQRTLKEKQYGMEARRRYLQLRAEVENLAFDDAAYEQARDEATQVERFQERMRHLEEVRGRAEQLDKEIERFTADEQALRTKLDDGSVFRPLQQQIHQLKQQLSDIGFDQERLREVKKALDVLEKAGERMSSLVFAQQNVEEWRQKRSAIEERVTALLEERRQQQAALEAVEAQLAGKAELERQRKERAEEAEAIEEQVQGLHKQQGQITEKLEQARRDRKALARHRKADKEANAQRTLYKHLKAAFGKHGIPSLIIEQTLPEIEDRANDLLERLTDGRMSVRLETLKDKKTGGTKETLDIKITDEQGVSRPYETFSGGEGFRVNFALRLALAQLLAERSGVRIRTLVIDEGFGTQDDEGVQSLIEAIQHVQDDFDKIVVITHLKELKEAFPVRIEVQKHPGVGSRFEVLGV